MSLEPPKTLLVLRFSAVGDIILTTAALESLGTAWPETKLIFVTKSSFAGLLRHNPHVHAVVGLEQGESTASLRKRLAAHAPEAILDLHGKLRSRLLSSLVPRARRKRWTKRPMWQALAVRLRLSRYRAQCRIAMRYHRAAEALVGRELPVGRMRYDVGAEDAARVAEILWEAGIGPKQPIVGMSPGAVWETKRWPAERFGELAARAQASGARVVLTGSAAEAAITARVADQAPGAVDLAGKLSLTELGALIDRCQAFAANDSGPMHMARALTVPTLAIFGSTDPTQFDFAGHVLLFAGAACSPCSLYGLPRCPKRHFRCMGELDIDSAWKGLEGLMAAGRPPPVHG